jgi:tetratricopeptide (TPR) repeat protein
MDARQYSAAIERFKDRLAKEPKDAGIPAAIGACYNELREYRQATPFFHQALELDPDLVSANAGLARCVGNDPNPDVPWSERMAKAALYMGKAIEPAVERVTRGRTGTYADLTDIYLCFYYLQNSTHVRGNAAKALTLLETATLIDPQAGNFRTKRMVTARPKIAAQAEKDAGKPAD